MILTRQLHRTSQKEGRLPRTLYIGADNTPKETKNSTTAVWAVFMLAALQDTSLERRIPVSTSRTYAWKPR